MENQNAKKPMNKTLVAVIAVIAVAAVLLGVWYFTRPAAAGGQKSITVQVVTADSDTETTLSTTQEYLRGALEDAQMIEGTESEYGLFVTTVNGVTADDAKQEWWCFTKDGEMLNTGVDSTPLADGDHFEITLTEGY